MTLSLVEALAIRENLVRLTFDNAVYFSAVLDPGDASDAVRYALTPLTDTRGDDGLPPRLVYPAVAELASPAVVHLWTDRKLSPYPSRYRVSVNGLMQAVTLDPLVVSQATFDGLQASGPAPLAEVAFSNADIANPQTFSGALGSGQVPDDAVLGTYPVDNTGDIAKDEGLVSYKKRVLRRLSTPKGRYKHLPDYGILAAQSLKHLARPGLIRQLADDAEDQIRQEPETVAVQVRVVMQGSIAFFRIRVRCSFGQTIDLLSPVVFLGE